MYFKHDRRRRTHRASASRKPLREKPVWPLPKLDGNVPCIVRYDEKNKAVELDLSCSPSVCRMQHIPVFALKSGVIVSVSDSEHGRQVLVDHQNGYSSSYAGLIETAVEPRSRSRKRVKTGDVIGYVQASSRGLQRTLRFTLFQHMVRDVPGFPVAFDPRTVLSLSALQAAETSQVAPFVTDAA